MLTFIQQFYLRILTLFVLTSTLPIACYQTDLTTMDVVSSVAGNEYREHHLTLDYSDRNTARDVEILLSSIVDGGDNSSKYSEITSLTISGYGSLANWTLMEKALKMMVSLQSVYWQHSDPMPGSLIVALNSTCPTYKLFYHMPFSNWDPYDHSLPSIHFPGHEPKHSSRSETRAAILGSTNLHSLVAQIEYGRAFNTEDLRLVHQIITSCPNLRRLDLSIQHRGCVVNIGQPRHFDFQASTELARAAFPPLSYLKLQGYDFDGSYGEERRDRFVPLQKDELVWPFSLLPQQICKHLSFDLIPYIGRSPSSRNSPYNGWYDGARNIDGWLQRMSWHNLQSLDLGGISSATLDKLRLHTPLLSLQNLSLHGLGAPAQSSLQEFLKSSQRSLTLLHLCNHWLTSYDGLVVALLTTHTQLQSLTLHHGHDYNITFLSPLQVQLLSSRVRGLNEMSIDMIHSDLNNKTLQEEVIHAFASQRELKSLNVWLKSSPLEAETLEMFESRPSRFEDFDETYWSNLLSDLRLTQRNIHDLDVANLATLSIHNAHRYPHTYRIRKRLRENEIRKFVCTVADNEEIVCEAVYRTAQPYEVGIEAFEEIGFASDDDDFEI